MLRLLPVFPAANPAACGVTLATPSGRRRADKENSAPANPSCSDSTLPIALGRSHLTRLVQRLTVRSVELDQRALGRVVRAWLASIAGGAGARETVGATAPTAARIDDPLGAVALQLWRVRVNRGDLLRGTSLALVRPPSFPRRAMTELRRGISRFRARPWASPTTQALA